MSDGDAVLRGVVWGTDGGVGHGHFVAPSGRGAPEEGPNGGDREEPAVAAMPRLGVATVDSGYD